MIKCSSIGLAFEKTLEQKRLPWKGSLQNGEHKQIRRCDGLFWEDFLSGHFDLALVAISRILKRKEDDFKHSETHVRSCGG